jgi:hypothetical protein
MKNLSFGNEWTVGFDGTISNCVKKLGIAPDPQLGHYSLLASECLSCASLPNNDLSLRSIAEGPGSTLSLQRESHLHLTIRPSQRYWCLARQIRSRFGKAAVDAEPIRSVRLHSAWHRFYSRRLAARGGMPGKRGTGPGCQTWAGGRPAGSVHSYSALVERPAQQPHSTGNPQSEPVGDLGFARSPYRHRSCSTRRGHRIRWNHPLEEGHPARSTPFSRVV